MSFNSLSNSNSNEGTPHATIFDERECTIDSMKMITDSVKHLDLPQIISIIKMKRKRRDTPDMVSTIVKCDYDGNIIYDSSQQLNEGNEHFVFTSDANSLSFVCPEEDIQTFEDINLNSASNNESNSFYSSSSDIGQRHDVSIQVESVDSTNKDISVKYMTCDSDLNKIYSLASNITNLNSECHSKSSNNFDSKSSSNSDSKSLNSNICDAINSFPKQSSMLLQNGATNLKKSLSLPQIRRCDNILNDSQSSLTINTGTNEDNLSRSFILEKTPSVRTINNNSEDFVNHEDADSVNQNERILKKTPFFSSICGRKKNASIKKSKRKYSKKKNIKDSSPRSNSVDMKNRLAENRSYLQEIIYYYRSIPLTMKKASKDIATEFFQKSNIEETKEVNVLSLQNLIDDKFSEMFATTGQAVASSK